jgi:PadR family transcriptional regulator PadR
MSTDSDPDDAARRKGTAELLVLAQLEVRARHGYEIGREIERRSDGRVVFQIASLYPVLYRLEGNGLITGQWVETPGQRRRRFYKLTPSGGKRLAQQRHSWGEFFEALRCAGGIKVA